MPRCDDVNMNIVRGSDNGIPLSRCGPSPSAGATGPRGATGPSDVAGPTGAAASSNALAYTVGASTVASGGTVPLTTVSIQGGDISRQGLYTLRLRPGTYLVHFVSDVSGRNGDIGAVLKNSAGNIASAATLKSTNGRDQERVVLSSILTPAVSDTLSVVNNSSGTLIYQRSSLTVTKLD